MRNLLLYRFILANTLFATLTAALAWSGHVRPVFEADDFGDALTPELREQEARLAAQIQASTHR